jgi:hypothetical protein
MMERAEISRKTVWSIVLERCFLKPSKFVFVVFVIMVITMTTNQAMVAQIHAQSAPQRYVSIPVKVVFVGIDPATVDLNYIKWGGNLPTTTFGQVLEPPPGGNLTGVLYNVSYTFTFANSRFKSNLESYLQSIQEVKSEDNPWFYYYTVEPTGYVSTSNFYSLKAVTYDANKVENWIFNNQNELGGFPSNGWTLMLMNLPELPSYSFRDYREFLIKQRSAPPNGTAHYYSVRYQDLDLGYQLRYRDYMTGWGGVHRFWFNDLSAGPSFWTSSQDLPLQIALEDNHIDLHTPYGKTWLTQNLADFIFQGTWNIVTPFFEYTPSYSEKYTFDIHVFDNRTDQEKQAPNIRSTVDPDKIRNAFQDLLPYSKIQVSLKFEDLSKYPGLEDVIRSNYKYTDSFTFGVSGQPLQYGVVDARSVYKYFEDNLQNFEPNFHRDRYEFTVPVFAFAFSRDALFTFTYKWIITKPESQIKSLLGVALGDMALVSLSQQEFQRGNYVSPPQPNRGEAFTEVIIHESGHMLGLPHPHNFGPVGDFILSAMGYYTYDYAFGQSDKDALQRAHVDQIYLNVKSLLAKLSSQNPASGFSIGNQLNAVDQKYSQMDYASALSLVLQAEQAANKALASPFSAIVAPATYVIVGIIVGFVISWITLRHRTVTAGRLSHVTVSTGQVLARHAYCTNCGKPTRPSDVYCHYCGARLSQ